MPEEICCSSSSSRIPLSPAPSAVRRCFFIGSPTAAPAAAGPRPHLSCWLFTCTAHCCLPFTVYYFRPFSPLVCCCCPFYRLAFTVYFEPCNWSCFQLTVYFLPFTWYCAPFTVHRLLFPIYLVLLFTVYFSPFIWHCLPFTWYFVNHLPYLVVLFTIYLSTVYQLPGTIYHFPGTFYHLPGTFLPSSVFTIDLGTVHHLPWYCLPFTLVLFTI